MTPRSLMRKTHSGLLVHPPIMYSSSQETSAMYVSITVKIVVSKVLTARLVDKNLFDTIQLLCT